MKTEKRLSLISYIIILTLVLLREIPLFLPTSRTWGFSHLIYLPEEFIIAFFVLAGFALIVPFIKQADKWGLFISQWFNNVFMDSRAGYWPRLVLVMCMTVLFIAFTTPTHFLGDCYILIKNLAPATGMFFKWDEVGIFKWSEIGIAKFMIIVKSLIGGSDEHGALIAFRVVSIVSGVVTIWFFFLIARILSEDKIKRLLIFTSSFLSGLLLLFFGYAEYYHVIWAFMTMFIYFATKYIKYNRGIAAASLVLLIGTVFHLQTAVFFPALLFAVFSTGRGREFYDKRKKLIWGTIIGFSFVILAAAIFKIMTDLYIEDMFLPPFTGKPVDRSYAAFSPSHLLDIFNEFILIAPLFFVMVVFGIKNVRSLFKDKTAVFLALSAAGCLLFLFLIDPKLGMPRDWDLFSYTVYPVLLLFFVLAGDLDIQVLRKMIISIILILIISPLPFLLTNLNRESSAEYVEDLIALDQKKTIAGLIILYDYYEQQGNKAKTDSLGFIYHVAYPRETGSRLAMDALEADDIKTAEKIIEKIGADKFDASYQRVMARLYYKLGDYDKALEHIEKTIQLRRYFSEIYWERAMIYLEQGEHEKVFADLRKGLQLNESSPAVIEGMAFAHNFFKNYDSSIYYAQKLIDADTAIAAGYFWLAKSYFTMGFLDSAKMYADRCAEYMESDSAIAAGLRVLRQQIDARNKPVSEKN